MDLVQVRKYCLYIIVDGYTATNCVLAMQNQWLLHIAQVPPRGGYTKGTQKTHRDCHMNRYVLNRLKFKIKQIHTMNINRMFFDDSVNNRRVSEIRKSILILPVIMDMLNVEENIFHDIPQNKVYLVELLSPNFYKDQPVGHIMYIHTMSCVCTIYIVLAYLFDLD